MKLQEEISGRMYTDFGVRVRIKQENWEKKEVFRETVHVNITLPLSPKTRGENTKLHTGLQYNLLHGATVFTSAGEATIEIR